MLSIDEEDLQSKTLSVRIERKRPLKRNPSLDATHIHESLPTPCIASWLSKSSRDINRLSSNCQISPEDWALFNFIPISHHVAADLTM